MCQTVLYKDTRCKHRWMRITVPCFPGAGFTTCRSFSYNNIYNHVTHQIYAQNNSGYSYSHQQPPVTINDGLCHQPSCPYRANRHASHYTPTPTNTLLSPILPPSTPFAHAQSPGEAHIQGHAQIQGHNNTCHVHLPGPGPYHQVQVQHNCPHHQHLVAKPAPPAYIARSEPCPECDLGGVYDRNQIRMVTAIKKGVKLGGGPSGGDPGVELRCCVM